MFVDLGNGTGVPAESIQKYAQEHGISRQEARARMRAESDVAKSNAKATAEIDAMPQPASQD